MAITKTSLGNVRRSKNRLELFDIKTPTDKVKWDALFAPDADLLNLNNRHWRAGHQVLDFRTGTLLTVADLGGLLIWSAPGLILKLASGAVSKNALVRQTSATQVAQTTSQGQLFQGVALNDAADGQFVYVLTLGCYLVLAGNAVTVGNPFTTLNNGKTDAAAAADVQVGMKIDAVTVSAVDYDICTFSGNPTIKA